MTDKTNAWQELQEELEEGEEIEAIVFGYWGGYESREELYEEKIKDFFIPLDKRKIILNPEEAKEHMQGWKFDGDFGSEKCYAAYIWTNLSIILVGCYEGSTWLEKVPRNPVECVPELCGGG